MKNEMKLKIIDNFFSEQDFKEILSIQLKHIGSKEVKVYHNSIDKFEKTNVECISKNSVSPFVETVFNTYFPSLLIR